jgi:antitoxin component YwqK of YwqJK toxin-antitoxin module
MVGQFFRHSVALALGIAFSLVVFGGPGLLVADDIPEFALLPKGDEKLVLLEDADEFTGIADPNRPVEIIQERYAGGQLKVRREVTQDKHDNYILHGEWKMWDEAGNLIGAGEYRNDRREGSWFRLHTGKDAEIFAELPYTQFKAPFRSEAMFQDGKLQGKWIITDSEGRVASESDYVDGVRDGATRWNYVSGNLMRESVFKNGLLDGYIRTYDADSTLIEELKFEQGHKIAMKVEHNEAGQKIWEAMFMHAQLVIDTDVDWWNAKPATFRTEGEDVKHGLATGWHANGQMRIQGVYDRDQPNGQFTWWYENGQEEVTGSFKYGLKEGLWVWRHPNGQKSMMGENKDGAATGVWYKWQEDGRLVEKTDFSATLEQKPSFAIEKEENESPVETTQTPLDDLFTR